MYVVNLIRLFRLFFSAPPFLSCMMVSADVLGVSGLRVGDWTCAAVCVRTWGGFVRVVRPILLIDWGGIRAFYELCTRWYDYGFCLWLLLWRGDWLLMWLWCGAVTGRGALDVLLCSGCTWCCFGVFCCGCLL